MINHQDYIILNFTDIFKSELSIIQTQVFREQIEQLKEKVSFLYICVLSYSSLISFRVHALHAKKIKKRHK